MLVAGLQTERREGLAERDSVEKPSGRIDIHGGGSVDRAGDATGHRIDRFALTAIALGGAGVDEPALPCQVRRRVCVEHGHPTRISHEVAGRDAGCCRLDLEPGGHPRGQAAVQDGDLGVSEVAQQPPGSRRRGGVGGVVDDDGAAVADAAGLHRSRELARAGKRMAPAPPGWGGQRVIEVDEHCARDVRLLVSLPVGAGTEAPAHVEQRR